MLHTYVPVPLFTHSACSQHISLFTHVDFKLCSTQTYRKTVVQRTFPSLNYVRMSCQYVSPSLPPPPRIFVFPTNQNILLHNHRTVVKIRKLTLRHSHRVTPRCYSRTAGGPGGDICRESSGRNPGCTRSSLPSPLMHNIPSVCDSRDLDPLREYRPVIL